MAKVYAVRKAVGNIAGFLTGADRELVISVMEKLGASTKTAELLNIPVWYNGKTRRGGQFTYRRDYGTFADWRDGKPAAPTIVPVKIELHPALYDEAHPERRVEARAILLHEIAHYIANDALGAKGHDAKWKRVMRMLGETPNRCHDLEYVTSTRKQVTYECQTCGFEFKAGRKLKNDGRGRMHTGCHRRAPHFGQIVRTTP